MFLFFPNGRVQDYSVKTDILADPLGSMSELLSFMSFLEQRFFVVL